MGYTCVHQHQQKVHHIQQVQLILQRPAVQLQRVVSLPMANKLNSPTDYSWMHQGQGDTVFESKSQGILRSVYA